MVLSEWCCHNMQGSSAKVWWAPGAVSCGGLSGRRVLSSRLMQRGWCLSSEHLLMGLKHLLEGAGARGSAQAASGAWRRKDNRSPSSRGWRVFNRALMHGTTGAAAGAEQLRKEGLRCSGLALKKQDTLSSTEGAQLPPGSCHEVPWIPPTRQSYVTTATEAAWHQEVNSAGQWQSISTFRHARRPAPWQPPWIASRLPALTCWVG